MTKLISFTSGSKKILVNLIHKHPNHVLHLYKSNTEDTFVLSDWYYHHKSIFTLPNNYKICQSSDKIYSGPFINLLHLSLGSKDQKNLSAYIKNLRSQPLPKNMTSVFLLRDLNNPSYVVVGTSWNVNTSYLDWFKNSFIHQYIKEPYTDRFNNNLTLIR